VLAWAGRVVDLVHRAGLVRALRVPGVTVVSVGGLTMGGSGKTPVTMALAAAARAAGRSVAIVLRGYGGTGSASGLLVSDGTSLLADVRSAGDEAILHARRSPGVLVRIGADRAEAVRRAALDGARLVIVDDGFQHRRLARDVDLVCLGAPGGLRREADAALARADVVVALDGATVPAGATDRAVLARTVARGLVEGPALEAAGGVERLHGARVALACGIARPDRFVRTVEALGAIVVSLRARRDHATLRPDDLACPRGADFVLVTEKDLVKIARGLALRIDVVFSGRGAPPRSR
jgi:tetraacyldisaccharide 4'-kinase